MTDNNLCGWMGKVLWIDLAAQTSRVMDTSDMCKDYVGGRSLAAKFAWDYLPPGTKSYDAANLLMFMSGPLAGSGVLSGGRGYVFCVGPQTYPEHFTRSTMGGRWATALKWAGYDGVIIVNKATSPLMLEVDESGAIFHDGTKYWGRNCQDTQKMIAHEFGDDVHACVIGQAGENKIRIACIMSGISHAAGQGGFGAVMGDKMLKGIFFHGNAAVKVADPVRIQELRDECMYTKSLSKGPSVFWGVMGSGRSRMAPPEEILGAGKCKQITFKGNGCVGCGIDCCWAYTYHGDFQPAHGTKTGLSNAHQCTEICFFGCGGGTEISSQWYKEKLGRDYRWPFDYSRGAELSWMGNSYGINSFEIKALLYFLTELEMEGVNLTEFLGMKWDVEDPTLFPRIVEKIAFREGIGELLGEGMARVGEKLGGVYKKFSGHTLNGYTTHGFGTDAWANTQFPHWVPSVLAWAVETRDPIPDSMHGYSAFYGHMPPFRRLPEQADEFFGVKGSIDPDPALRKYYGGTMDDEEFDDIGYKNKEYTAKKSLIRGMMMSDGVICDVLCGLYVSTQEGDHYRGDFDREAKLLSAVTGENYTTESWEWLSERTLHLARLYNVLEINRNKAFDMSICDNIFPRGGDWTTGKNVDRERFSALLDRFYALMGWDAEGVPTVETLKKFNLDFCIEKCAALHQ